MSTRFQHACSFLQSNEKIADYLAAIGRQTKLLRDIQAILPSPLEQHCLHAHLEAGVLTLLTDSPVWSSRLRFFAPEIERRLAPGHGPVSACRIRVRPRTSGASPATSEKASNAGLSSATAQHLIDVAAGVEDLEIANALRRLAKTGMKADST